MPPQTEGYEHDDIQTTTSVLEYSFFNNTISFFNGGSRCHLLPTIYTLSIIVRYHRLLSSSFIVVINYRHNVSSSFIVAIYTIIYRHLFSPSFIVVIQYRHNLSPAFIVVTHTPSSIVVVCRDYSASKDIPEQHVQPAKILQYSSKKYSVSKNIPVRNIQSVRMFR